MAAEPHLHIEAKAGLGDWLRAMAARETRREEPRPRRASAKKRARRRQVRASRRANR